MTSTNPQSQSNVPVPTWWRQPELSAWVILVVAFVLFLVFAVVTMQIAWQAYNSTMRTQEGAMLRSPCGSVADVEADQGSPAASPRADICRCRMYGCLPYVVRNRTRLGRCLDGLHDAPGCRSPRLVRQWCEGTEVQESVPDHDQQEVYSVGNAEVVPFRR